MTDVVTTHDYTRLSWGHNYTFKPVRGGLEGQMLGWGKEIRAGDFLLLQNGDKTTRYRIRDIRYYVDPEDMWEAWVVFAPRKKVEDIVT
jgi:hypothetical protein